MDYTQPDSRRFADDMADDGREVEDYAGRAFWFGPATRADDERDLQAVIRATTVILQWDSLGEGYIVYPIVSEPRSL